MDDPVKNSQQPVESMLNKKRKTILLFAAAFAGLMAIGVLISFSLRQQPSHTTNNSLSPTISKETLATAASPKLAELATPNNTSNDGLLSLYKIDEGSGQAIASTNGTGTGELVGGTTWSDSSVDGRALNFDGKDDLVKITDPAINNLQELTVSSWVNARSMGEDGSGVIVSKDNGVNRSRFVIRLQSDNSVRFNTGHQIAGAWKTPVNSITLGRWHNVVVAYAINKSDAVPTIYIDGKRQDLTTITTPSGAMVADSDHVFLGSRGGSTTKHFDGYIDRVRIYNKLLNEDEAKQLKAVDTKPNVIVIMTDDQRADDMVALPKTKQLIGDKGMTFANSFVDYPQCCPSRTSFITGQASHNTGVQGNDPQYSGGYETFVKRGNESDTLPVWVQKAGYATIHSGKYLNGYFASHPAPAGWTQWDGIADDQGAYSFYNYTLGGTGYAPPVNEPEKTYKTDVQRDRAATQIAASNQPLFLSLTTLAPHSGAGLVSSEEKSETGGYSQGGVVVAGKAVPAPRHQDQSKYMTDYAYAFQHPGGTTSELSLPKPVSFKEELMTDKPETMQRLPQILGAKDFYKQGTPQQQTLGEALKDVFVARRASLLAVDDLVEKLVTTLEATGQLDNTYIIFTSDNGWMQGEHRITAGKTVGYEESIKVPLLIRGPGIPAGQTRSQLVSNLDVVATIEALTGAQPSSARQPDGCSLIPLFQEEAPTWRSSVLIQGLDGKHGVNQIEGRYQGVRTARYKYIEHERFATDNSTPPKLLKNANGAFYTVNNPDGNAVWETEFYDLLKDPFEMESKKRDDPVYAEVITELERRLKIFRTCKGANCVITTPEPTLKN